MHHFLKVALPDKVCKIMETSAKALIIHQCSNKKSRSVVREVKIIYSKLLLHSGRRNAPSLKTTSFIPLKNILLSGLNWMKLYSSAQRTWVPALLVWGQKVSWFEHSVAHQMCTHKDGPFEGVKVKQPTQLYIASSGQKPGYLAWDVMPKKALVLHCCQRHNHMGQWQQCILCASVWVAKQI